MSCPYRTSAQVYPLVEQVPRYIHWLNKLLNCGQLCVWTPLSACYINGCTSLDTQARQPGTLIIPNTQPGTWTIPNPLSFGVKAPSTLPPIWNGLTCPKFIYEHWLVNTSWLIANQIFFSVGQKSATTVNLAMIIICTSNENPKKERKGLTCFKQFQTIVPQVHTSSLN